VTVTRKDLQSGTQLVQSAHSLAEFAHEFPDHFHDWIVNSKYLISLSVDNEEHLKNLYDKLKSNGANVVAFTEPDINDQLTSICYYGTPEMRKLTEKLDLALKC
jgi:chaperonin GroEL (HSP60 family)